MLVFLSYSREDRASTEDLVALLESRDLTVWWDQRIRDPERSDFDRLVGTFAEHCSVMVALWSERSARSNWVHAEALIGRARGVLLNLSIDGTSPPEGSADWGPGPWDEAVLNLIETRGAAHESPRKTAVTAISAWLDDPEPPIAVVTGPPGSAKDALVRQALGTHRPNVRWIDASTDTRLREALGAGSARPDGPWEVRREIERRVRETPETLVLRDLRSPLLIPPTLDPDCLGTLIVTTGSIGPGGHWEVIPAPPLNPAEALLRIESPGDPTALDEVEARGGMPGHLEAEEAVVASQLRASIRSLPEGPSTDALHLLGFVASSPLSIGILRSSREIALSDEVIEEWTAAGLVQRSKDDSILPDPNLRSVMQDWMTVGNWPAYLASCLRFARETIESLDDAAELARFAPHVCAILDSFDEERVSRQALGTGLAHRRIRIEPTEFQRMMVFGHYVDLAVSATLRFRGAVDDRVAFPVFKHLLHAWSRAPNEARDDSRFAEVLVDSLFRSAACGARVGAIEAAEMSSRALSIVRERQRAGRDLRYPPSVALNNHAAVLFDLGIRQAESLSCSEEAVRLTRAATPPSPLLLASQLDILARITAWSARRSFGESNALRPSIQLLEESLELRREHTSKATEIAVGCFNLAAILEEAGDSGKATALYEEARGLMPLPAGKSTPSDDGGVRALRESLAELLSTQRLRTIDAVRTLHELSKRELQRGDGDASLRSEIAALWTIAAIDAVHLTDLEGILLSLAPRWNHVDESDRPRVVASARACVRRSGTDWREFTERFPETFRALLHQAEAQAV